MKADFDTLAPPLAKRSTKIFIRARATGAYLLLQRASTKKWDLPGGGVEAGETDIKAAIREIREETGLFIPGQSLIDLDYRGKTAILEGKHRIPFACDIFKNNGVRLSSEHLDYRWVFPEFFKSPAYQETIHEKTGNIINAIGIDKVEAMLNNQPSIQMPRALRTAIFA